MSKTILVVDDLATQRTALRFALTGAGYTVLNAENGQEAWKQLQAGHRIDLIISDLQMPVMDGLGLLQKLKQETSFQRIPVLFLLMESQLERKAELRQAGAAGWVLKPFQPDQLCSVVQKLVP